MKVRFYPAARDEFQAAAVLYEQISPGLGRGLENEVRRWQDRG